MGFWRPLTFTGPTGQFLPGCLSPEHLSQDARPEPDREEGEEICGCNCPVPWKAESQSSRARRLRCPGCRSFIYRLRIGWGQTILQTADFLASAVLSGETGLRATPKFKNRLEGLCENRQSDPRNGLRFPFGFPHTDPVLFFFVSGPRRSKYGHTPSEIF